MSWLTSIVGGVMGSMVSAYGSVKAGRAASTLYYKQAAFKEEQAEFAAREGRRQSELLKRQKAERIEARRLELARILGAQRARYWASGVTLQGTPLLVAMESQARAEEDISRLKYWFGQDIDTAELQSHMLSHGLFKEASYLRAAARAAKSSGYLQAASSIQSGAAQAGSQVASYYGQQYSQYGAQTYTQGSTGASTAGSSGRPY